MTSAIDLIAPVVKVSGTELSLQALDRLNFLRVSSGLRLPSRAVLQFTDTGFVLSAGTVSTRVKSMDRLR